jgi:hypothetical protein
VRAARIGEQTAAVFSFLQRGTSRPIVCKNKNSARKIIAASVGTIKLKLVENT